MAEEFLSETWLEALVSAAQDMPEHEGASLVIQHEIAGAPAGKVRYHLVWAEGRLETASLGKHAEPDVMVQAKAPDALRVLRGELDADVAYMQGRLKVDGEYRKLLVDLRDWRSSDAYRSLWTTMADLTA